ncbi:MAG: hypothetical protein ACREHD_30345 [Pirellulales bacterium]
MRSICFLAVAAVALAFLADEAQAGGRRTRYYSYGASRPAMSQSSASQAAPSNAAQANAAQSTTVRRYSYSPAQGSTTRYSYYGANGRQSGSMPYNWRADRKVLSNW